MINVNRVMRDYIRR